MVTEPAQVLASKGIPVVPVFNETVPLWEFHRDNGEGHECTHFCFPSAPQVRLLPPICTHAGRCLVGPALLP